MPPYLTRPKYQPDSEPDGALKGRYPSVRLTDTNQPDATTYLSVRPVEEGISGDSDHEPDEMQNDRLDANESREHDPGGCVLVVRTGETPVPLEDARSAGRGVGWVDSGWFGVGLDFRLRGNDGGWYVLFICGVGVLGWWGRTGVC